MSANNGLPKPTHPAPPMPSCNPAKVDPDVKMQEARVVLSNMYLAVELYKEACDQGGDPDGTWKKVEEMMLPTFNWLSSDAVEACHRNKRLSAKVDKPLNEFTQADVDSIVRRARELGSGKGCDHKSGQFNLGMYHMRSPEESLGYLLVNAWEGKRDLIHAVTALIEHFTGNKTET